MIQINLRFYTYLLATNYDSGIWILLARQNECLVEKAFIYELGALL